MAIYAEHNQDYSALGRLVLPTGVRPNHSPNEHIESCLLQMSPSRSRPTGTPCPLASPHTHTHTHTLTHTRTGTRQHRASLAALNSIKILISSCQHSKSGRNNNRDTSYMQQVVDWQIVFVQMGTRMNKFHGTH